MEGKIKRWNQVRPDFPDKPLNITFFNGEVGTVFEGKSQFDLTLAQLLRKKAKF